MNTSLAVVVAVALGLTLGFFALHAATAPPVPQLPDTVAGRRITAFLAAFNSGQETELRQLLSSQYDPAALQATPIETRVHTLKQFAADAGKLTVTAVNPVNDHEIAIVVTGSKAKARFEMTFLFTPDAEHRLQGARIRPLDEDEEAPEPEVAGKPLTVDGARQAIETDLAGLVQADRFSGVVRVSWHGALLFEHAYGLADREHKLPNTLDTKFNLGSINKVFTKLAIAQLAERGKLSLSDPLIRYLPDYPNPEVAKKITLEQLASHTSGLGDIFTERFPSLRDKLTSLPAYLPLFADKPLEFEPGARSSYSNAGYVVLGLVIERVSGVDYYTYVRQNVFTPAGMKDTDSYALAEATPNRAIGYTSGDSDRPKAGARRPNQDRLPARGSSAGGGYSTAGDLARFAKALSEDRLVGPAWTRWVVGGPLPKAGAAAPTPAPAKDALPPIDIGAAGGSPGLNAVLEIEGGGEKWTVVVLSNYDPPSAQKVSRRILTILGRIH
jgi:CubicO group peptidase (beta-lactamase class C family)